MRILLLSHLFPKPSDRRHGIFVLRQAEQLRDLGHEIVVVAPIPYLPAWLSWVPRWRRYKHQDRDHKAVGFEVHRLPFVRPPGAWFQPYEWLTTYYGIRATVRRWHAAAPFDIVYAQDVSTDVRAGARIAADLQIACIGMAIGIDLNQCADSTRAYRNTIVQGLQACSAVVCNSEALAEKVTELTHGKQSGVVITRGVDIQRFCPVSARERGILRQRLKLPENGVLTIYAGYLDRRKGVYELVEAFCENASSDPNAHLILVGVGTDRDDLMRLVAERKAAGRIHFPGHIDHEQMPSWLQACDIVAMTSWSEGMPNALVEAIACGLPAVATAVGGIPQAVRHEHSGILVEPTNVPAIAAALKRLLSHAEEREQFGRRARQIAVSEFDTRENSRRLSALLQKTALAHQKRIKGIGALREWA